MAAPEPRASRMRFWHERTSTGPFLLRSASSSALERRGKRGCAWRWLRDLKGQYCVAHGDAVARQSNIQNEEPRASTPSFTSMSTNPPM